MGDTIAHRGPDDAGWYADDGVPSVGLSSRRLAVIDVEHGAQPMSTEDEAFTLVYNGEIFNAQEVRNHLEGHGHRFRTRSDTEVVLRGYVQWGPDVVNHLNGMWAFAVWERPRRRLVISRDRLGVKPLVYAQTAGGFVFGSEIKALVASGLVERRLDPTALPHYLSCFAIPEPYSLVAGVQRLRAGHMLVVDADGCREHQYWDCAIPEEDNGGADWYSQQVSHLLHDSVRRRLVSDVPLGVLLSGGVDSQVIASIAARERGDLDTFTLGFDVAGADERIAARQAATALGSRHHEDLVVAASVHELPDLIAAYDEPGQSLLQNDVISRFARRNVTVALSGLGGDELFAAYPTHVLVKQFARYDALPPAVRAGVGAVALKVPSQRVRRFAALAAMDPDTRSARELLHQVPWRLRDRLLASDLRAEVDLDGPERDLREHFGRARSTDPLNRLLYVYIKTYLTDELLRATDAMSMRHSLEIRTPFLDYRLVELAMGMPSHHKLRWKEGKLVLRDVARQMPGIAPAAGKRGFSPPMAAWLRDELGEQVRDALSVPTVSSRGVFDPAVAQEVLRGALAGDQRMLQPAMMLYAFETWGQRWLDRAALPDPVPASIEIRPTDVTRDLSVVIVNWNTREILRSCLQSVTQHLGDLDHEVIVVDNASSDGSPEMVAAEFADVRLVRNSRNVGFGVANNQAMRIAHGRWFLLLNSDTVLTDDSVATLFSHVQGVRDLGVAHCRLEFPDGRLQHTAYRFPTLGLAVLEDLGLYKAVGRRRAGDVLLGGYWDHAEERDVDWVAGAFMMMPREVFDLTGGFDERLFMYGEDLEWCQRIRDRGWRIRYYPQASIVHLNHSSSELRWGDDRVALCLERQRDIYAERHGRAKAALFLGVGVIGAGLRAAYYAARGRLGGEGARGYREMTPHLSSTFRTLVRLAATKR